MGIRLVIHVQSSLRPPPVGTPRTLKAKLRFAQLRPGQRFVVCYDDNRLARRYR
jgi:hypothetical protein